MTDDPARFPVASLKHVVSLRRSPINGDHVDLPYVGLENIESWTGRFVGEPSATVNDESDRPRTALGKVFEPGDVLFGKLRPYLAKAWVADFSGRSSTEFLVMQPVGIERRFLQYALVSRDFVDAADAATFGSRMPRAEWSDIGSLPIPLPEPSVQCAVVAYLDRETARIDSLIVANKRLLDLTVEKRCALTTQAATQGLDPNVRLRDSGIPWLGKIPSHWDARRTRWLFRERDERSQTGEEDLLSVSHLTGVTLRSEKDVNMFEAETKEGYKLCRRGDLVVNTLCAWMGAMGVAREDGIVSPAYNIYEPSGHLHPGYLDMIVRLPLFAQEANRHSKGVWSSRLRLYPDSFFDVSLPVPPPSEQAAIAEAVVTESLKLDALAGAADRSVSLLQERRSAVIAAAVTGEIDLGVPT